MIIRPRYTDSILIFFFSISVESCVESSAYANRYLAVGPAPA